MKIFPSSGINDIENKSYYVDSSITNSGETDIQIIEKEKANPIHYLIGIVGIIALVIFASNKLDNF